MTPLTPDQQHALIKAISYAVETFPLLKEIEKDLLWDMIIEEFFEDNLLEDYSTYKRIKEALYYPPLPNLTPVTMVEPDGTITTMYITKDMKDKLEE